MFQSFIYFLQITGIKIIFFIEEPDLKFYHNTENLFASKFLLHDWEQLKLAQRYILGPCRFS